MNPSNLLDLDRLGLDIVVQPFETAFPTVSGLLKATKRRIRTREVPIVDGDCSRFDLARHAQRSADVVSIDAGCRKSEFRPNWSF